MANELELIENAAFSILETTTLHGAGEKVTISKMAIVRIFSSYPILKDKGKVSSLEAKLKAEAEFEVFRERQDKEFVSDFDREIKRIQGKAKEDGK